MAAGVSRKNMNTPFIGIASSFTDLVPGHVGMRDLERQIEKGIHTGGGQSFISVFQRYVTVFLWGIPECGIPFPQEI